MYSFDSCTAEIMMDLRRKEIYEEIKNLRLAASRGMRWPGFACQGGRALVQLGQQIVALGQWLERGDPARSSV